MRPIKTRPRFKCDFCRRTSSKKESLEFHEKVCYRNPNRSCELCNNKGKYWEDYGIGDYIGEWIDCEYCSKFNKVIESHA